MRLLGYLLIVASTILGALAAATAYAPTLDALGEGSAPLTLAAPAGRDPGQPDQPVVAPGDARQPTVLTPEIIQRLRAADVQRVHVKEFSLTRWGEAWLFAVAIIGLVGGGLLVRRDRQQVVAARSREVAATGSTPRAILDALHADLAALLRDLQALPGEQQSAEVLRRVEEMQSTRLVAFADARPEVLGRLGVAGLARVMDPFAAAERQINRAWSAAADRALAESVTSLTRAVESLEIARARLAELMP